MCEKRTTTYVLTGARGGRRVRHDKSGNNAYMCVSAHICAKNHIYVLTDAVRVRGLVVGL